MDNSIKKSYNKYRRKYRIDRANLDSDNWSPMLQPQKVVEMLTSQDFKTTFKHRPKPYRPYFLWSVWWIILSTIKGKKIQKKTDNKRSMSTLSKIGLIIGIIAGLLAIGSILFKIYSYYFIITG